MIDYLILVNISLVMYFVIYWLLLRKLTFFQWNRIYLLASAILSVVVPLAIFVDWGLERPYSLEVFPVYTADPIVVGDGMATEVSTVSAFSWIDYLRTLYWISVVLAICWFLYRLNLVRRAFRKANSTHSFSFFGKAFVGEEVLDKGAIQAHEEVHIRQGHTYDIVLLEVIQIFNWFNPILILYKRELKFQHELIADGVCTTDKVYYAQLLLAQAMQVSSLELRHEFSNYSFLKKRITMLFQERSSKNTRLNYMLLLPILLLVGAVAINLSCTNNPNSNTSVQAETEDVAPAPVEPEVQEELIAEADSALAQEEIIRFPEPKAVTKSVPTGTFGKKKEGEDVIRFPAPKVVNKGSTKGEMENVDEDPNKIFTSVTIPPEPVGGINAFRQWIGDSFVYPPAAVDAGVKGVLEATFVVEKDGSLADIMIVRDLGHDTKEAFVDVLKNAKRWKPGIQNGKPVRTQYRLPIRLDVNLM